MIVILKRKLDVTEMKESRNAKTSAQRRQTRDEVVFKKHELA